MKIITRYILREALVFFGLSLFAFTSILLTLRILKFAGLIINKGVPVGKIAMIFLAIIPTFLEFALPMATVLGVMLAFARLSGDSEIIVFRSSGISITQLIAPVAIFGLLVGLLSFYVSMNLKPWGFRTLSQGLFDVARSRTTSGLSEGVFNKLGNLTLYAKQINYKNGELHGVLIDDRRNPEDRKIVSSLSGLIRSDPQNRTITFYLKDGVIHQQTQGRYVLTEFANNSIVTDPDELNSAGNGSKEIPSRELTYVDLLAQLSSLEKRIEAQSQASASSPIDPNILSQAAQALKGTEVAQVLPQADLDIKELKKLFNRARAELGARFSMPYASFILALLAMPLGIHPPRTQRTWGIGLSACIGLAVFVVYFGLISIGSALGENGKINPYLALWIPNLIATMVAGFFLFQMCTERWQSVTFGIEKMLIWINNLLRLKRTKEV